MRFTIIMVAHLFLVGGDFMDKSGLIILVSNVLFTFLGGSRRGAEENDVSP